MIDIQNKEDLEKLIEVNEYVLIDFYAPWCSPCRALLPLLEKLSEGYKNITFCKVNVDNQLDLSFKYKITSIPHIFFIKNGNEFSNFRGLKSKKEIIQLIENFIS
jgi:thioredoxin 1